MDEDQNALAEQLSGDDEDVENGGIGVGDAEEIGNAPDSQETAEQDDPYGVKKRLGMQAKKHQREMRQMQEQMMHMQQQMGGNSADPQQSPYSNPYPSPGQPNPPAMSEEEKIHKAVRFALGVKEHEEQQAQMAERQAQVRKHYERLNDEFDKGSEKYDDFDEVVRESDAPFTNHVRDALLLVKNPAEVAYLLGKNRPELEIISRLHPIDQAREVNALSHSLMSGNDGKNQNATKPNPLASIRNNPVSNAVTGNTSPAAIRAKMKAGTWK